MVRLRDMTINSITTNSMTTKKNSLMVILFLCSLISGCANLNKDAHTNNRLDSSLDNSAANDAAELLNRHWRVSGKLAIRSVLPSSESPSAQALRFEWQQQAQDYNVTLSGPLGLGRVTVTQQNQRIYLSHGKLAQDKNAIEASDIDQLFAQQTGWTLPISYLRYWALGLPAPDQAFTPNKNSQAELVGFQQDGWKIHYPSITLAAPYPLPSKLIATNKHFKLVIAFKHWQFPLLQPISSREDAQ
jgi:outer membrane lipoprotein LolB